MRTTQRPRGLAAALFALFAAAACLGGACTVRTENAEAELSAEEAERDLERAGEEIERAGEELADGARRLGAALDREAVRLNRELEPRLEDAALAAKVKARLAADPEVNPFEIDVDVVDGVVTLGGMVESEHERTEAEELARRTKGVREVISNLQVGERTRT